MHLFVLGACFIDREGGIESLIKISETSQVLSIKATAFYALSLVATTRFGCQVLASKGWCTLKYGRDDPWPVLEDWFIRFQIATMIDQDEPEEHIEEIEHAKIARRSSSLQYTPVLKDDDIETDTDENIHPRSSSLSSRKRLSNIFKSLSDKKDGGKSSSITRRIKRSLFKENSLEGQELKNETIEENEIPTTAPIATPERSSQSSSVGEPLGEITEGKELKNECKSESDQSLPMTSAGQVKPIRMKQRSGQRAYSESEAQTFLITNPISSIVPGASITSMASTGSYTDNPGYLTLRSIHNRHRPVLDFIETGDDHEHAAQERLKRSDSMSTKKRHSSGSTNVGRKLSSVGNRKKLLGPLKDEDLSKVMNDRYWGITLPAKMDLLLNDKVENTLVEDIHQIGEPPASPGSFEYHSEDTCLQCYNYLETDQINLLGKRISRIYNLTVFRPPGGRTNHAAKFCLHF